MTAILDKQVTPTLLPPPSALTPRVELVAGAETVYTDGSYKGGRHAATEDPRYGNPTGVSLDSGEGV